MSQYTKEDILEVVLDALKKTAQNSPNNVVLPESLTRDTEFKKAQNLDSLDNIELIARLEEHFQLMMNDKKWIDLKTLGEVCDDIELKLSQ